MRFVLLAATAALTLSACGSGEQKANTMTTTTGGNMMASDNMMAGDNMMMTNQSGSMSGGAMGGNMMVDPTTANMMRQDMNTNAPDTNLANGM